MNFQGFILVYLLVKGFLKKKTKWPNVTYPINIYFTEDAVSGRTVKTYLSFLSFPV